MILPYDSRGFETGPGGGAERPPISLTVPQLPEARYPPQASQNRAHFGGSGPVNLGLSAGMNPTTSISQWGSAIFGDLRSDLRYPLFLGMHRGNRLQRLSPQQTFQNVAVHPDLSRACRTSPG